MSLAFDENGRPFIIIREQDKKKRTKGLEAHKVRTLINTTHTRFPLRKSEGELELFKRESWSPKLDKKREDALFGTYLNN